MSIHKEHTRISLVEGGNVFKQGENVTLGFTPRDYAGNVIDLTGKQIAGTIYSGRRGIMYESPATFDAAGNKIVFTIDEMLDYGICYVEFTVTDSGDANFRMKLPSNETGGALTIKPSSENMDFFGVSMTTVAQLRNEQQALQTQYEQVVDGKVSTLEATVSEVESTVAAGIGAFTVDSEVVTARGGEINLKARLDKTNQQLAETSDTLKVSEQSVFSSTKNENDVVFNVAEYKTVYLQVDRIFDTTIRAYTAPGSSNAFAPVTNLATGMTSLVIGTTGVYQIDVSSTSYLRFNKFQSNASGAPVTAKMFTQFALPKTALKTRVSTNKLAKPAVAASFNQPKIIHAMYNKKIYASEGNVVYSSANFGADNFPTVVTTLEVGAEVKRISALENGAVLILLKSGKLLRTADNFVTVGQVFDFGTKSPHDLFGIDVYNNIVLMTEYATIANGGGKKVYLSTNHGATFTEIFDLDLQNVGTNHHTHHACYDPYENIIWVATGDGEAPQMIFYSRDTGATWQKASPQGFAPTQATMIIPMRDCVLFISDARLVSVIRYNRPSSGTPYIGYLDFELAFIVKEGWGKSNLTEVPIASTCTMDYENNRAYFGYGLITNSATGSTDATLKYGNTYMTNGYEFKEAFKSEYSAGAGVWGVFGNLKKDRHVLVKCNQNVGYVLDTYSNLNVKKGTGTIAVNQATAWIAHGLPVAPAPQDIQVTQTSPLGIAKSIYVSLITDDGFAVRQEIANPVTTPNTAPITFNWKVDLGE